MIDEAEIRREAVRLGVDLMVVDLDYVIGCFLETLYRQPESQALIFKGGTCLKKCYYADYRFSEDLDFTLNRRMDRVELEMLLKKTAQQAQDRIPGKTARFGGSHAGRHRWIETIQIDGHVNPFRQHGQRPVNGCRVLQPCRIPGSHDGNPFTPDAFGLGNRKTADTHRKGFGGYGAYMMHYARVG